MLALLPTLGACSRDNTPPPPPAPKLAMVARGDADLWWRRVRSGAARAAREAGRVLIEVDPAPDQAGAIRPLIASRVGAILVAPAPGGGDALTGVLREAAGAGIPLVFIDDPGLVTAGIEATRVSCDDEAAGVLAAEFLTTKLSGGEVLIVGDGKGTGSADRREIAFRRRLAREAAFKTIDAPPTGPSGRRSAQLAIEYALDAHPSVGAVFCPDENSTAAALQVIRERSISGRLHVIGVETNPTLVEAMASGDIDALVIPAAAELGRRAVLAAISRSKGEQVEPEIRTAVTLVTRESMHDRASMDLLLPELVGEGN